MALVAIFSFIFGHLFVGCNWFAVLWNLSVQGSMLYGVALAPAIFLSAVLGSEQYYPIAPTHYLVSHHLLLGFAEFLSAFVGNFINKIIDQKRLRARCSFNIVPLAIRIVTCYLQRHLQKKQ
jgi:hypothetical protein